MKKQLSLLEIFAQELKLLPEQKAAEALPTDVFGAIFAGEERGKKEPNTPKEDEVLDDLSYYFRSSEKNALAKDMPLISTLANQNKYAKYLKAPANTEVYRILNNVPVAQAAAMLRLSPQEIKSDDKQAWYVSGGGIVRPLSRDKDIQGWSTDLNPMLLDNIAGQDSVEPNTVQILLVANTSQKNFFINGENIAKDIPDINKFKEEKEVISYGPVDFIEAAYFYISPISYDAIYADDNLDNTAIIKNCIYALNTHHIKKYRYKSYDLASKLLQQEKTKEQFKSLLVTSKPVMDEYVKMIKALPGLLGPKATISSRKNTPATAIMFSKAAVYSWKQVIKEANVEKQDSAFFNIICRLNKTYFYLGIGFYNNKGTHIAKISIDIYGPNVKKNSIFINNTNDLANALAASKVIKPMK